jgi:hypothetical protein
VLYPNVTNHALLTKTAAARVAESTEHQELAETLLGLQSPALTVTADVNRVKLAIVAQINFQVHQEVEDLIYSYQSSRHSNQQKASRDRVVSQQALMILANIDGLVLVTEERWATFTSHRTRDDE